MRGDDNQQEGIFSYISPEKRVPAEHPLRPIRKIVDEISYRRRLAPSKVFHVNLVLPSLNRELLYFNDSR
jgi:hypothetical protein